MNERNNRRTRSTRHLVRAALVVALVAVAACGSDSSETTTAPTTTAPPPVAGEASVFTHCGWYEMVYEDVLWTPVSITRGSSPEGTDSMATPGLAERSGDRLTFTADSGLVVEFELAPSDLPPPPPCD